METGVMRHRGPRSAAPREATAEAAREDLTPRAPGWWRRIWRRALPPPEAALSQDQVVDQLNRQLAVLEKARAELEAGWIQGAWWAVRSAGGGRRLVGGFEAGLGTGLGTGLSTGLSTSLGTGLETGSPAGHIVTAGGQTGRIDGVCLVGALARAGHSASDESSDTGRAVDAVYDALWASRGQPALEPRLVPSPQVRLARVRTLTQWNDRPGRTRSEVLTLVDHAISATMLDLAAAPRPVTPHPAESL